MVSKVLIDQGNSINTMYWKTVQRLEVSSDTIHPYAGPLLGLAGERVETRGHMDLMTTFGQGKLSRSFTIRYLLVDANTSYFALISRKTLNELRAIVSMPHLKMKFPTLTEEIVTVKTDQKQARQCYVESLKVVPYPPTREPAKPYPIVVEGTQVMSMDERSPIRALTVYQASLDNEFDINSCDDTDKLGQCVQLSKDLTNEFNRNTDLFAWQPSDMSRIICHKLGIYPQAKPIS